MRMAMIGLGKMGSNMARRLRRNAVEVVCYDRTVDMAIQLDVDGVDLQAFLIDQLQPDVLRRYLYEAEEPA